MRIIVSVVLVLACARGPLAAQGEEGAPRPAAPGFTELEATALDGEAAIALRRQALGRMRELEDERVVPFLERCLGVEGMKELHPEIVGALAGHGDKKGVRPLLRRLLDEAEDYRLRSAVLRALMEVEPDWMRLFERLLADESKSALHGSLVSTAAYGDPEAAREFLLRVLRSHADRQGPSAITYAANRFGIEETYRDFLQPFLSKQAEPALRDAALAALGRARDERFLRGLLRYVSKHERRQGGARWLPLLGALDDRRPFDIMLEIVEEPRNAVLERVFVAEAAKMKSPHVLNWFRSRGAKQEDAMSRLAAIASMRENPDAKNVLVLKRLCEVGDDDVAGRAISALGKQPREAAEKVLRKQIEEGSVQRAVDALDACSELCGDDPGFVAQLMEIAGESRAWELRVVAMKLLQERHAAAAREIFVANASHRRGAVRIGAYDALTYVRGRETVDFLVERLEREEGRPLGELVSALTNLTGRQLGRQAEKWASWWSRVREEYPLPPRPERAVVVTGDDERYGFYGIHVDSHRVVFVVDTSGSMSARANSGTDSRIYRAKNELKSALSRFGERHAFNVIAFSGLPVPYAPSLVTVSPSELEKARAWIDALSAAGGTNIYDPLEMALEMDEVDTVFLLSDGSPGSGKHVDTDMILESIRRMNRFRRIKINTIGIGVAGEARRLVEELARQNWGTSVIL